MQFVSSALKMGEWNFGIFFIETHGVLCVVASMLIDEFGYISESVTEHLLFGGLFEFAHQQLYNAKQSE